MPTTRNRAPGCRAPSVFAALALLLVLVVLQCGRPSVAHSDPPDRLGTKWIEHEPGGTGWTGSWTRSGTSNSWNATWTKPGDTDVTGDLTISLNGNAVTVSQNCLLSGEGCSKPAFYRYTYIGILTGNSITGTALSHDADHPNWDWNADIIG
jgi:hypothetical protein